MSRILVEAAAPNGKKFAGAPFGTFEVWTRALAYSALAKTDGFVPAAIASQLAPGATRRQLQACLSHLTTIQPGCVHPSFLEVPGGYQIHDYDDPDYFNPTTERVRTARETGAIGGRKSAEVRKQRYGSAQPTKQPASSGVEANPEGPPSKPSEGPPLEASRTPSPALPIQENNSAQRGSLLQAPQTPQPAHGADEQLQAFLVAMSEGLGRTLAAKEVSRLAAWWDEMPHLRPDLAKAQVIDYIEWRRGHLEADERELKSIDLLHAQLRGLDQKMADDGFPSRHDRRRSPEPVMAGVSVTAATVNGHRSPTHLSRNGRASSPAGAATRSDASRARTKDPDDV